MCRDRARTIPRETAHHPLAGALEEPAFIPRWNNNNSGPFMCGANTRVDADRWMELADH